MYQRQTERILIVRKTSDDRRQSFFHPVMRHFGFWTSALTFANPAAPSLIDAASIDAASKSVKMAPLAFLASLSLLVPLCFLPPLFLLAPPSFLAPTWAFAREGWDRLSPNRRRSDAALSPAREMQLKYKMMKKQCSL